MFVVVYSVMSRTRRIVRMSDITQCNIYSGFLYWSNKESIINYTLATKAVLGSKGRFCIHLNVDVLSEG